MIPTGATIPVALSLGAGSLGAILGPVAGCAAVTVLVALAALVAVALRRPGERRVVTPLEAPSATPSPASARRPAA